MAPKLTLSPPSPGPGATDAKGQLTAKPPVNPVSPWTAFQNGHPFKKCEKCGYVMGPSQSTCPTCELMKHSQEQNKPANDGITQYYPDEV